MILHRIYHWVEPLNFLLEPNSIDSLSGREMAKTLFQRYTIHLSSKQAVVSRIAYILVLSKKTGKSTL